MNLKPLLSFGLALGLLGNLPAWAAGPDNTIPAYDANLSTYPYPFPTRTFPLTSQGQTLAMSYMYLPATAKDKPVVTLLHGKNFNGAYWEQVARHLQKQGYGVFIPDQIGFGKSAKPVAYQYSFAALAHNTHQLQQALGIQTSIVVGHSMGGMLATRFALLYPSNTEKLILINPIGLENYLHYVAYKDVDFFYQQELKTTPESIQAYQQAHYYDGHWNSTYDALTHFLVGQLKSPDWHQVAQVNARTYDMIFTQPVVTELRDLLVPMALILGTRDRTGPGRGWMRPGVTYELGRYDRLGEQTLTQVPTAQLFRLEGLGHLPHIERFEAFAPVFEQALHLKPQQSKKQTSPAP